MTDLTKMHRAVSPDGYVTTRFCRESIRLPLVSHELKRFKGGKKKPAEEPWQGTWQRSAFVACASSKGTLLFWSRLTDKGVHQRLIVSSGVVHSR